MHGELHGIVRSIDVEGVVLEDDFCARADANITQSLEKFVLEGTEVVLVLNEPGGTVELRGL